jgi:hypothetical protein
MYCNYSCTTTSALVLRLDKSCWNKSCCLVLYCIVLYCIVLYCIVLYCIVLYCIVLRCVALRCAVSCCIFPLTYVPNPPCQLSLWEETGVPGGNPRLSAERWLLLFTHEDWRNRDNIAQKLFCFFKHCIGGRGKSNHGNRKKYQKSHYFCTKL